ncbi:denticleless protein homolog [Nilaparvata lugens]|uniref:denticleless protein homolog n=1 Tax=Nilaparvata lugens TaxID=108931 RepID=UPI00193DF071|nr:denticleless protein homolog [Nilaparvata lugens]
MNVIDYFNREYNGRPSTLGVDLALKRLTVEPLNTLKDFDVWDSATCKFCKTPGNEDYFAVVNEAGNAAIVDTKDNSDLIPEIELKAHDNAIFDLDWSDCDNRLLMGSGDRTASLWDLHEGELTKINDFAAHTRSLRTVAFTPQQKDVFATGGRDGLIVIWDARSASPNVLDVHTKPENIIQNVKLLKKKDAAAFSICSVLFQDSVHLFSCGISET